VFVERILRSEQTAAPRVVRMLIVSAGALSAFSALRLAEISLRTETPVWSALDFMWRLRFNSFYGDLNAAGSLYALFLVPAIWIAWRERRIWAGVPSLFLGLALWLAGSRAAVAAAIGALGLVWLVSARPKRGTVVLAGSLALIVVALITGTSVRNAPPESAFNFRAELTKAAFRLAAEAPVFGIGLNRFKPASAGVFSDEVINQHSWARYGENAHNNFLQILVELGVVGLAAFLWLLTPLFLNVWRRLTTHTATPAISGLAGGVTAFLLSALLGHPLLSEHVQPMFFLTLGVATGISASAVAPRAVSRLYALAFALAFFVLLACLPVRIVAQRQGTNLDGVAFGASDQKVAIDGILSRVAEAHSSWFIAGDTRAVQLPLRTTPESELPCRVAIALDGTEANVVSPTSDMWTQLELQLTPAPKGQRWRRLDLRVLNDHCRLVVGDFTQRR
jgi:hypothetical protein